MTAKSYLLKFTTAGNVGQARFQWSNDNGISRVQTYAGERERDPEPRQRRSRVRRNNLVTEEYEFYVSYSFLRADNTNANMHGLSPQRNMTYQNVKWHEQRASRRRHGRAGHDRLQSPRQPGSERQQRRLRLTRVLDADGVAAVERRWRWSVRNPTNDMVLGSTGVNCLMPPPAQHGLELALGGRAVAVPGEWAAAARSARRPQGVRRATNIVAAPVSVSEHRSQRVATEGM
jgi:hypothetical protein